MPVSALDGAQTAPVALQRGRNLGLKLVTMASHVICIGAGTSGADVDNSCYIGSIAGQTVGAGGTTCYVDNDGKLGVFSLRAQV